MATFVVVDSVLDLLIFINEANQINSSVFFCVLQENNAIGKVNLSDPFSEIVYHSLGRKDWSGLMFDGSFEDGGRLVEMQSSLLRLAKSKSFRFCPLLLSRQARTVCKTVVFSDARDEVQHSSICCF